MNTDVPVAAQGRPTQDVFWEWIYERVCRRVTTLLEKTLQLKQQAVLAAG